MLQNLVDLEPALAHFNKVNALIDAFNRTKNNFTFYINGDAPTDGDLNYFKTPHAAMAAVSDVAGNVYTVHVKSGQYNGAALNMPTKAVVNFIGEGAPVSAYFNFDVNFTPDATHPGQMQCQKIVFGGAFNLDATASPNCNLQFFTCGVGINQIDNNNSVTFFMFQVGMLGGTIKGKIIGEGVILINNNLNLEIGSNAEFVGLLLTDPTLNIVLTGSAQLKTIGTVNKSGAAYVQGIYAAPNTPKWITDEASDSLTNGTLSVEVVGFEEITVDITGTGGVLDLSGKSGFSIINLQNGDAIPELNQIINYQSNRNFFIRPNGIDIKVNDASVSPGYNLKLNTPFINIIGTQKGFIEFSFRQGPFGPLYYMLSAIDQYV